jgi:hypothetical protein
MKYLFALLLLASQALAVELKLPVEVKGEPAAFITIRAETPGKTVRWIALDAGLNLFPVDLLKDTKTAVVSSAKPGRYRLLAVTAAGDEPSDPKICTVIVGNAPTPPPDNPPQPDSELAKTIKTAWAGETAPDKSKNVKSLAALYRQAPTVLDQVQTAGQLYATLRTSADALLPKDSLGKVRAAIGEELKKVLPADPQIVLSDMTKQMARSVFSELATVLEAFQ